MKPLILLVSLIVMLFTNCSSESVVGPESDDRTLEPANRCSVVNASLC